MSSTITITFEIEAPELAGAINNLAQAFDRYAEIAVHSADILDNYNRTLSIPDTSALMPAVNLQTPEDSIPTAQESTPQQYSASINPSTQFPMSAYTYQTSPTASSMIPASTYSQQPSIEQNSQQVPSPPTHNFSFDDLARAAWSLVEGGKQFHFIELLRKFGIQALTQLPKEQFAAFALALRQLGVGI